MAVVLAFLKIWVVVDMYNYKSRWDVQPWIMVVGNVAVAITNDLSEWTKFGTLQLVFGFIFAQVLEDKCVKYQLATDHHNLSCPKNMFYPYGLFREVKIYIKLVLFK